MGGGLLIQAERGPAHSQPFDSLPPSPAVPGEPQGTRGGAVTAFRCVLHQPGCASPLLHVQAGGALRDAEARSLHPPDPVGVAVTPDTSLHFQGGKWDGS